MAHSEYNLRGLTETTTYTLNQRGEGELRAVILDYHPDVQTGLGEPCEAALLELTFRPEQGEDTLCFVKVVKLHSYRHTMDGREWMNEVIANEATADGDLVRSRGTHNTLFQYSTVDDVTWGDVLDDVLEYAYLIL